MGCAFWHLWRRRRLQLLGVTLLLVASTWSFHVLAEEKPPAVSVESFVSALDRDGDGEICTEEANKFLESVLETTLQEGDDPTSPEEKASLSSEHAGGKRDVSMAELMNDHKLDISFNYGGSSISAAEMSDHLGHMLTGDRVVAWVVHGLRLPQYADAFKHNSIDGLDFPALISDNGAALRDDLGVASSLHRNKIQQALVRQVFGIGKVPGPPEALTCHPVRGAPGDTPKIFLDWDPPSESGIPPYHKFLVRRKKVAENGNPVRGPWEALGDAIEDSFVDSAGLQAGAEYQYRVQSWGAHGPSEWTNVSGCVVTREPAPGQQSGAGRASEAAVLIAPASVPGTEECPAPGVCPAPSDNPLRRKEAVSKEGTTPAGMTQPVLPQAQASSAVPQRSSPSAAQAGGAESVADANAPKEGTLLGYVWSVNGGILALGLLSRSSLLYRAFSSASMAAWRVLASALPSHNSSSPVLRRLAHSLDQFTTAFHALSLAILAAIGLTTLQSEDHSDLQNQVGGSSTHSGSSSASGSRHRSLVNSRSLASSGSSQGAPSGAPGEGCAADPQAAHTAGGAPQRALMRLKTADPAFLGGSSSSSGSAQGLSTRSVQMNGSVPHDSVAAAGAGDGSSSEGSRSGSDKQAEKSGNTKGLSLARLSSQDKSKNRCSAEGCPVQFGAFVGFVENLKRHYCMDCQSWYCFRHTRIASHTGVCGFDSQCCCYTCFSRLPAEQQQYLESINKLQPSSTSGDPEATGSRGKSGAGLSRRPSLFAPHESAEGRDKNTPQGADTEGEGPGPGGAGAAFGGGGSTVRRAVSEYQLLEHAEEGEEEGEEEGREDVGEGGDFSSAGQKRKGMRKSVSNPVVDQAVAGGQGQAERKPDGEGRWQSVVSLSKSVLSTLSLSNKSGESSSVGSSAKSGSASGQDLSGPHASHNGEGGPAPVPRTKGLGLGLGLVHCHTSSTERGGKTDQNSIQEEGSAPPAARSDRAIALLSSFDKISEIEDETEDAEGGGTRGALGGLLALRRNASGGGRATGSEGRGSPSDMVRQPSFGKSRSYREESGRLEGPQEEGAQRGGPEAGDLLAHQRSSSYEHLAGAASSRSGDSDGPVIQSQSGEEQRKAEGGVKRGLRKGMHTLTHLVPGSSSPHQSEASTGLFHKVRDLLPRGLHDGARSVSKS